MAERIGASFPPRPGRKKVKGAADTERFHEEMKIKKAGEAEFEKPKKRQYKLQEEEESEGIRSSPYEPSFYQRTKVEGLPPSTEEPPSATITPPSIPPAPEEKETLPEAPQFYKEQPEEKQPQEQVQPTKEGKPEKPEKPEEEEPTKQKKEGKTKEEASPFFAKEKKPLTSKKELEEKMESPYAPTKPKAPSLAIRPEPEEKEEKITAKKPPRPPSVPPGAVAPPPKEEEKGRPKPPIPEKKEKKLPPPPPSFEKKEAPPIAPKRKEEVPSEKKEKEYAPAPTTLEISPHIQAQATGATQQLSSYLSPEVVPLFERMVGTIMQMSDQGIARTEVTLTSPAFVGSVFYGVRVILEKYATAPDSFNVRLIGPEQAVTAFNDNIEGLMRAFDRGHFSFRIGRLWAEYETERPLFKRKPTIGEEGKKEPGGNF